MTGKSPLTPAAVDKMLKSIAPTRASNNPSRIIWTLPAIGRRIGVGADFVRDNLANHPGSPVRSIGGRYYAFEEDLIAFLRER